jgi:hypothetical protein
MAYIYIFVAALVVAGWAAVSVGSRRALQRNYAELRLELQRQIDALSANVKALERTASGETAVAPSQTTAATEEITPEILRRITETVSGLLGRKVRIRSVKILETPEPTASSWAQQGRVVIQASHNLGPRGHEL